MTNHNIDIDRLMKSFEDQMLPISKTIGMESDEDFGMLLMHGATASMATFHAAMIDSIKKSDPSLTDEACVELILDSTANAIKKTVNTLRDQINAS